MEAALIIEYQFSTKKWYQSDEQSFLATWYSDELPLEIASIRDAHEESLMQKPKFKEQE